MSEPFIGEIRAFGFNWAPRGWSTCDGQLVAINDNQSLFSLINNYYGGDGRTNFALPDLRSRVPMHQGQGSGLSPRTIGQRLGVESGILSLYQMPIHNHQVTLSTITAKLHGLDDEGDSKSVNKASLANSSVDSYGEDNPNVEMNPNSITIEGTASCQDTGGNQPFNLIQPSLVLNWCIALEGLYPSRS